MNNKVKVIKAIKGLEVGDILYLKIDGDNSVRYINTKTTEDISENKTSIKTIETSIDKWIVEQSNKYFIYLDDNDNEVQINNINYEDLHSIKCVKDLDSTTKNQPTTSVTYYKFRSPIERYLVWL